MSTKAERGRRKRPWNDEMSRNGEWGRCVCSFSRLVIMVVASDSTIHRRYDPTVVQRTGVRGISKMGRATQGVRVMNLRGDDTVSAVAVRKAAVRVRCAVMAVPCARARVWAARSLCRRIVGTPRKPRCRDGSLIPPAQPTPRAGMRRRRSAGTSMNNLPRARLRRRVVWPLPGKSRR